MKKWGVFFVALCMLLSAVPALAYDYPNAFWAANAGYEAAVSAKDYAGIINYGNQVISVMQSAADGAEKQNILITRYNELGYAYAALGDYDGSADAFSALVSLAEGDAQYAEYVKGAKARILQYKSRISLYTDGGTPVYFGAKNEKQNGVLYGVTSNSYLLDDLKTKSLILTYQELGHDLLPFNTHILKKAKDEGLAVEFALNCPNEGADLSNIQSFESYLSQISGALKTYSSVPVYLRFAAEFDVWTNETDPETFKNAFRYVSNYFKQRNENAAIVWSPNQVSKWTINVNDFYPGDEYVDFVGMSLYAQPYFGGDKNADEGNEIFFRTGLNSNPVLAAENLIKEYGNRKPIMISESGCGHKIVSTGEDTTAFAVRRLKEYLSYLPMVYPEIKVMAYFDQYIGGENTDFRLSDNDELKNTYTSFVQNARFVQGGYENNTDFCYRKIEEGTAVGSVFPVSCYAHKYGAEVQSVTYYLDGAYVDASSEVPYTVYLDAGDLTGVHTLKAVALFSNGQTLTRESAISVYNTNENISVEANGSKIAFDQPPIIYNDRTLVPMRKIFEVLGASVSWNDAAQTATGVLGDRTVSLKIGSSVMEINGEPTILDTAPIVVNGRTLVPARAVAEGLGCLVDWQDETNTVVISKKHFPGQTGQSSFQAM